MSLLIFGGSGFLEKQLIQKYYNQFKISIFNSNHNLDEFMQAYPSATHHIGDIRDCGRIKQIMYYCKPRMMIIIPTFKSTYETNPNESIKTNILGINNILDATMDSEVEKCIFVSNPNACLPINAYGMCVALGERLTFDAGRYYPRIYMVVRHDHILQSDDSYFHTLRHQAQHLDNITIMHPDMTRFFATTEDVSNLYDRIFYHGRSGEIWVPILPNIKVIDLAELLSKEFNKPIKVTGLTVGEKIHEDLINPMESLRTAVRKGSFNVIQPGYSALLKECMPPYSSNDNIMSKEDLATRLQSLGMLA